MRVKNSLGPYPRINLDTFMSLLPRVPSGSHDKNYRKTSPCLVQEKSNHCEIYPESSVLYKKCLSSEKLLTRAQSDLGEGQLDKTAPSSSPVSHERRGRG